jgi:hypothetical protein
MADLAQDVNRNELRHEPGISVEDRRGLEGELNAMEEEE